MKSKQQEIIEITSLLFSEEGIKKTSVDIISRHCGISKKTFYLYFPDKETIVKEIVINALNKIDDYIKTLLETAYDAITELINFLKFIKDNVSVFTPIFISDLVKFYPTVNDSLLSYRTTKFLPFFIQNVEKGILEGCYRKSVDSKLTGELYFKQIDIALEDDSVDVSEKNNILSYINSFFLHGIVNGAGAEILFPCLKEEHCKL